MAKKIILNAGHTKSGAGSGAVGYLNESAETRRVVSHIKYYLEGKGHTVIIANVHHRGTSDMRNLQQQQSYADRLNGCNQL